MRENKLKCGSVTLLALGKVRLLSLGLEKSLKSVICHSNSRDCIYVPYLWGRFKSSQEPTRARIEWVPKGERCFSEWNEEKHHPREPTGPRGLLARHKSISQVQIHFLVGSTPDSNIALDLSARFALHLARRLSQLRLFGYAPNLLQRGRAAL